MSAGGEDFSVPEGGVYRGPGVKERILKEGAQMAVERDPWAHRAEGMRCHSCMFYVPKVATGPGGEPAGHAPLGRCRRHAPTMGGFPAVFPRDWCGDHKLDESKV